MGIWTRQCCLWCLVRPTEASGQAAAGAPPSLRVGWRLGRESRRESCRPRNQEQSVRLLLLSGARIGSMKGMGPEQPRGRVCEQQGHGRGAAASRRPRTTAAPRSPKGPRSLWPLSTHLCGILPVAPRAPQPHCCGAGSLLLETTKTFAVLELSPAHVRGNLQGSKSFFDIRTLVSQSLHISPDFAAVCP